MFFDQREFEVRCEWGERGVAELAPQSDAVVVVDVLSFSTCVEIAVARGATVYPYRWKDDSAIEYARSVGAALANFERRYDDGGYSLAPSSLVAVPAGTRLVLPSPNGSTLTLATGGVPTFAGCLRNAAAVAAAVAETGRRIAVIPAGERWADGGLRPALEDLLGAGAIISRLPGTRSPEAELAAAAFVNFRGEVLSCLRRCGSGKELAGRGFERDIELAAALDVSDCAPMLTGGAYTRRPG